MLKDNLESPDLSPIFTQLPDDIKRIVFLYAMITPSARAIKVYLGWYNNYLTWKKEPNCFNTYIFYYLKPLDRDLFLSLINYKIINKKFKCY
jgi:hypothetical protein